MHKRDNLGYNASYWAVECGHPELLSVPGLPPPSAPLVEEAARAFQIGHAHAMATNPKATALPSTLASGKKAASAKKKKGKK